MDKQPEDFDKLEKKVHNTLFNNEQNEYSQPIQKIRDFIRQKHPDPPIPSTGKFLQKIEALETRPKNQIPYYATTVALAASIMMAFTMFWPNSSKKNHTLVDKNNHPSFLGKIYKIKGQGVLLNGKEKNHPTTIQEGDLLTTKNANVNIYLPKIANLHIAAKSELIFQKLYQPQSPHIQLKLTAGKAFISIKKSHKAEQFQIKTAGLQAEVRGTKFVVSVKKKGDLYVRSSIEVIEGSVAVYTLDDHGNKIPDSEIVLENGQKTSDSRNKKADTKLSWLKSHPAPAKAEKATEQQPAQNSIVFLEKKQISRESILAKYKFIDTFILKNGQSITGIVQNTRNQYYVIYSTKGVVRIKRSLIKKQTTLFSEPD